MSAQHLLKDQTVIVTGAATGIGQAFALGCAAQGARVVAADMNAADDTVQAIERAGGQALVVRVDVSDAASVQGMAEAALKAFGRIDGLINNAAYFREVKLTPFEEIDPAIWDKIFQVNVKGVWNCCKAVMPAMRRQGSGSIVNIASVVAVAGQPGYLHYVATKGAVLSMTKGLAKECGAANVRVNVIAPGFVITDATSATLQAGNLLWIVIKAYLARFGRLFGAEFLNAVEQDADRDDRRDDDEARKLAGRCRDRGHCCSRRLSYGLNPLRDGLRIDRVDFR